MYGKIFDSIYDGTLRANWMALVTFQQLIILGGPEGIVDMTPHAIHGRTGIPLEIIEEGLKHLAEPDPLSRSIEEDGRRVVLLDPARPWGWRLVNHAYYRDLLSRDDKREKDRRRIAEKREKENNKKSVTSRDVAHSRTSSPQIADVAHTDTTTDTTTDTDTDTTTKEKESTPGLNTTSWKTWVEYRSKIRKPLKPASIQAAQRKLAAFGSDQAAVVEQSIANGWQGIFDLKNQPNGATRERASGNFSGRVRAANNLRR